MIVTNIILAHYEALLKIGRDHSITTHSSLPSLEQDLAPLLEQYKVRIIIIDEIHNSLTGSHRQQMEFLNWLRFLGNKCRVSIVGVGTKDAYLALRSDPQLENRFEPFMLPRWQAGKEFETLLSSFIKVLPLRERSDLNKPNISQYILEKTEGVLGEISTLLRRATKTALLRDQEKIDESILEITDYYSPSERRQMFERQLS